MERRELLKRSRTALGTIGIVGLAGCSGKPDEATFVVEYSGSWSGALDDGGSARTISGSGKKTFTIEDPDVVSGNAQKQDDSTSELTVSIEADGDVVDEASTTAAYGVAQVSHSF